MLALPAAGQLDDPRLRPVDQAVGDLDLLSHSLRQVQRGLRYDGEQTSLFEVYDLSNTDPVRQPVYLRLAPGVTVRTPRLDYIVMRGEDGYELNQPPHRDGFFYEMIGANTVFELRPLAELLPEEVEEPFDLPLLPGMINTRIDGRIERRLEGAISTFIPEPRPAPTLGWLDLPPFHFSRPLAE